MKTVNKTIEITLQSGSSIMLSITSVRGTKKSLISSCDGWHDDITPESHPDMFEDKSVSKDKIIATLASYGDVEVSFSRASMRGHSGNSLRGEVCINNKRQPLAIVIDESQGDIIEKAIKEAQKEALNGELSSFDKEVLANAIEVVEAAEREIARTGSLLSKIEIEAKVKKYNQTANEGGDGFIPQHISKERYENAKSDINRLS